MRILLINIVKNENLSEVFIPHLGLGYLASYLRKYSKEKHIIKIVSKDYKKEMDVFKPDIVGISSTTLNYSIAKKIASIAKKLNITVIIGGTHITALPKSLTKDMNIGVIGEAEETFLEIINEKDFHRIKGIIYHYKDKLVKTEPRLRINNLDKIPFPARDLLKIPKGGTVHLMSSRGCPYNCVFCASKAFWGKKVRFFSAEYVIAEIKEVIRKYNPKTILFFDDLFIADKKRFKKLVELIIKEGIQKKINFCVSVRANLVTEDNIKLLKRMNCIIVSMGFESGNEKTLKYLKGGNVSVKDNWNAVRLVKKYGMESWGSFIIGTPQDTKESIMDTYNFMKYTGVDLGRAFILTPLPSTPVWDYALKKGKVSNDMDWSRLSMFTKKGNFNNKILLTENISRVDLWKLNKKFEKLSRRMELKHNIKEGIKHPLKILFYLKVRLS